jgi:hypothetical protein
MGVVGSTESALMECFLHHHTICDPRSLKAQKQARFFVDEIFINLGWRGARSILRTLGTQDYFIM